jgi:competence protein ComEC
MDRNTPSRGSLPIARQKMFMASLAFSVGIIFAAAAPQYRPPLWFLIAAIAFATGAFFLRSLPKVQSTLALLAIASLGALGLQLREISTAPPATSLGGSAVELIAHVTHDSMERPGFFGSPRNVVELETESVTEGGVTQNVTTGIRASLYQRNRRSEDEDTDAAQSPKLAPLFYGQRFRCIAKLRSPHNYGNPGAFDYRAYLESRGITYLASIDAATLEPLTGFSGSRPALWRSRLMRQLLDKVDTLWAPRDAALTAAMLLGDTTALQREDSQAFQRTGAYHILVVSGMNVGILAFVVFWPAQRLRLGQTFATVVTIALAAGYAYLTDAGAPVVRAALMLAIYLVSRLFYRQRGELNAIGTAALIILIARPTSLFDASFQLTFLAVVAIAGLGLPLLQHTAAPYRSALRHIQSTDHDIGLEPRLAQFRVELRMIADRVASLFEGDMPDRVAARLQHDHRKHFATSALVFGARTLCSVFEIVLISALMQLAMALPMAVYFHRANVVALPVNVLIVPLSTIQLPLAALAVAVSFISTTLARVPAQLATWALHGMTGTIHLLGHVRGADMRLPTPQALAALMFLTVLTLAILLVRRRGWMACAGTAALAAASLWIVLSPAHASFKPGVLEITAIDVGQGDSILVVSPDGKTLLIDGGGSAALANSDFDIGDEVVSPYLWSRGISHLDAVALTHAHMDHLGGLSAVITDFHPRELWVGLDPPTAAFRHLLEVARAQNVEVLRHTAGNRFSFGATTISVMAPAADYQLSAEPKNNDSLVLKMDWGKTSALLAGDVEKKQERFLAGENVQADLLKVAHHGSATSTTPELLKAVEPRFAVISSGYRNSFGHPRIEVLDRLQQAHVATFRTDLFGATTFYLDGEKVSAAVHGESITGSRDLPH